MATTATLSTLTINSVESEEVYNYMKNHGLLNENELYLTPVAGLTNANGESF